MYGVDNSEAEDLRNEYNFGGTDTNSAVNRPSTTNADPQEVHVTLAPLSSEANDSYSPRDNDAGYPASPYAFGTGPNNSNARSDEPHVSSKKKKDKKSAKQNRSLVDRATGKGKNEPSLETRWKNALKEEERLNAMQQTLNARATNPTYSSQPEPNFPPKFLCIRPLVYHSLDIVPKERHLFMKMAFWDWVAVCILLVANMVILIVTVAGKTVPFPKYVDTNKPLTITLSIVYMILGIPLSFILWYWRLFRALSTGAPGQYVAALCGLVISLAQSIFSLVGPYKLGVCGAIFTRWATGNRAVGYVAVTGIMTGLWGLQTIFELFMLVKCFMYYRKDLASRRRAKFEAQQQAVIG